MKIGLDIGSTTIKIVVLNDNGEIIYSDYERHFSQIKEKTANLLRTVNGKFGMDKEAELCISGSAGMGIAQACGIPFVQEVYATKVAVNKLLPQSDVVIELGGEDAKILFLSGADLEVRMNGSCAGGTGAFIDQMATLLGVSPAELNKLAESYGKIYTIASRCGVFAKSDIQPLINQGAGKPDIAASIFEAVVNQTVAGLAQGREIKGNVVYLGGPLTFFSQLRQSFDRVLKLNGTCPENSLYYVAYGAAITPKDHTVNLLETAEKAENYSFGESYRSIKPLFENERQYESFCRRHAENTVKTVNNTAYSGNVYIGIDAGSTTVKAVAVNEDEEILCSEYLPNSGNPVPLIKNFLERFYEKYPNAKIFSSAVTGYGEEIIKNAFRIDFGIVETVAHFTGTKKFQPNVDFIIDIGGQDIKCFKIRSGVIDNIFLNEACSSGCGSFLQTFAGAWGFTIQEFAEQGILAKHPVDLGSRCTVFMNSSVKQAQKDGALIEDISAGLSISVVKNALYKVIRVTNAGDLGDNIVVQGGTFLNDAVLRAFEMETGKKVVRPNIAGLMGAYGAALYSKQHAKEKSCILTAEELAKFTHTVKTVTCKKCLNHCNLTVNIFDDGRKFIGGNRCDRPVENKSFAVHYNMYEEKMKLLKRYKPEPGRRGKIGIPMGLNMYELLPFWHTLFTRLGFEVVTSSESNRNTYISGQNTIPSDTVCYPAKLMHGHIRALAAKNVDAIFYPCMTYNVDEGMSDNCYNCPVVAYYPEVIGANMNDVKKVKYINDYIGIHRKRDFPMHMHKILCRYFSGISHAEVKSAAEAAYSRYESHMEEIRGIGRSFLDTAEKNKLPVIILAGRPYHIDGEINHGIDRLICDLGAVVISEDAVSGILPKQKRNVLNQWTYHARLYSAAEFVAENDKNINLVQLVSFGCGADAITTDEVRSILEKNGKIYTQIKIDEITNLGAVKIRLRSLFAAFGEE